MDLYVAHSSEAAVGLHNFVMLHSSLHLQVKGVQAGTTLTGTCALFLCEPARLFVAGVFFCFSASSWWLLSLCFTLCFPPPTLFGTGWVRFS